MVGGCAPFLCTGRGVATRNYVLARMPSRPATRAALLRGCGARAWERRHSSGRGARRAGPTCAAIATRARRRRGHRGSRGRRASARAPRTGRVQSRAVLPPPRAAPVEPPSPRRCSCAGSLPRPRVGPTSGERARWGGRSERAREREGSGRTDNVIAAGTAGVKGPSFARAEKRRWGPGEWGGGRSAADMLQRWCLPRRGSCRTRDAQQAIPQ